MQYLGILCYARKNLAHELTQIVRRVLLVSP